MANYPPLPTLTALSLFILKTQGCSNPGLELANAFGVQHKQDLPLTLDFKAFLPTCGTTVSREDNLNRGCKESKMPSDLEVFQREQSRRKPTGAAKTLLRVAFSHPEVLLELNR